MTSDVGSQPLSARVNQLFATFHTRTDPEQSVDAVALSISKKLGREVSGGQITALRAGERDGSPVDPALLAALAQHFQVPAAYLGGDNAVAAGIDRELRLLAAARDAGVRHLALRGEEIDIDELAGQFSRLADDRSGETGRAT
ncbi:hypothetical protein NONI108955_23545 [Nocardia ninae]|uniref:ESX-1 secretion-associated regulator EspR n=1 Tax=Nocardia ninae NBRC 108245 TaxID=1210091 RepID=A0A511MJ34_9NOCA|nr:hypothetical protein [Nocardia ninae]GEM39936.1 hypothetical protein NN4_44550 [Nocardia ninae NBRC 108245]